MTLIGLRSFSSTRSSVGNVSRGQVFELDDNDYAKMLIRCGLAEEYSAGPTVGASSFLSPVGVKKQNGLSLQADQASLKKTVFVSNGGGKSKALARSRS